MDAFAVIRCWLLTGTEGDYLRAVVGLVICAPPARNLQGAASKAHSAARKAALVTGNRERGARIYTV